MNTTLPQAIRKYYSATIRQRGASYYAQGAVSIRHMDSTSVDAIVSGSEDYEVSLDWSGRSIATSCSCPYFNDYGPCKHLWATALAYDAERTVPSRLDGKKQTDDPDGYIDDEDLLDDDDLEAGPLYDSRGNPWTPPGARADRRGGHNKPQQPPKWKQLLASVTQMPWSHGGHRSVQQPQTADRALLYHINVTSTLAGQGLSVHVLTSKRKKNGEWGAPKPYSLTQEAVHLLEDPADRRICATLLGAKEQTYGYYGYYSSRNNTFTLNPALTEAMIPMLCATGRCFLYRDANEVFPALQVDDGPPWEFRLDIRPDEAGKNYVLSGWLHRGQDREDVSKPVMLLAAGWIFWPDRVAKLVDHGAFPWILLLRRETQVRVPADKADELLELLAGAPAVPPMDLPPELTFEAVRPAPRPCLRVRKAKHHWNRDMLTAALSFDYEGHAVAASATESGIYLKESRRLIVRDAAAEASAAATLATLGLRPQSYSGETEFASKHLPRVVAGLIADNWNVEAEGSLYRRAGSFEVAVSSGIDWFELHGSADFGGATASLPQLLAALRKGEPFVKLDDGSLGVLPEEWLRKFDLLAHVGTAHEDHLRFRPTQAGFLDALLAAQPEVKCDAGFTRVREELRRFERVEPADAPQGFIGQLRPYQRDGLGWLHFLQRFGFGGCLADDMGLGKTVQVLAMLESRRQLRAESGNGDRPASSLAVVPRSLIFNWREEAAKFTPALRVLDHTGTGRAKGKTDHFDEYDLILTTYGTLRRDAGHLKDVAFDYAIFDESQAIKNANTASAKAARLLQARHRLCLSGTPIENHLGELWSQFEVLNPGMLGTSPALAAGSNGHGSADDSTRQLLARALRPFILRRTKSQVATDLPEKTEQTLHCELETAQRKLYNELRDHYRQALLARVSRDGMNKAKIQILEALLRLRQAAIHPGLIDKARSDESSAKLETLLPRLQELIDEGHKTLVFSQFTSMLSIVRSRLDSQQIAYEYLDGRTRDRQEHVNRFQNDPACGLFLISLKAGGLGLNLTAAEYVFLLDPWWNPAVEAQAIDRAHRIGQQRQVFAYRLIAKDTVEDRIVELQQSKRALADAIINADNALIRDLSREDLELLLR